MQHGHLRMAPRVGALAALCAGFLGGIGVAGSVLAAGAADRARPIDACSLLTADEVSAVIGTKVDAGARRDDGWIDDKSTHGAYVEDKTTRGVYSSTCLWRASADRNAADPNLPAGGASFAILNVFAWPPGSDQAGSFLQKFRDAAESNLIPSKPVPLKIGDEALWWGDGVAVKSGVVAFGISVHLVDGRPKERHMEETLGAKLAARVAALEKRHDGTS
jgi:hypothetical protein